METIYFGDNTVWGSGAGNGPWVMADLENGLFSGANPKKNTQNPSVSNRFLTTIVKGKPGVWAIRAGDATTGGLSTYYNGSRPSVSGYNPMSKEGAIILGIGGDNSNGAQGTFTEGAMTYGYPSDAIENEVQANLVAAGYSTGRGLMTSGPAYTVGSSVSLRATTAGYTDRYLAHSGATVNTQVVSSSSTALLKRQASWIVRAGFTNSECFAFESKDTAGSFLRHANFVMQVNANDGSKGFKEDATFCPQAGLTGKGSSIRTWAYPTRWIRHFNNVGYISSNGGVKEFDNASSFNDDITWLVESALA